MNLSSTDVQILQLYRRDLAYHNVYHPLELLELHATGKTRGIEIPNYTGGPYVDDEWVANDLIRAIVCHDVVYNPGAPKGENERASFEKWCEVSKCRPGILMEPLIMATATHDPDSVTVKDESHRRLVEHMIDLDMSVLGSTREEFDRNSANVAQEFMTMGYTAEECRAGRLKFFESVLKQDHIFFTPQFYDNLEAKARQNMIEDLNAG